MSNIKKSKGKRKKVIKGWVVIKTKYGKGNPYRDYDTDQINAFYSKEEADDYIYNWCPQMVEAISIPCVLNYTLPTKVTRSNKKKN